MAEYLKSSTPESVRGGEKKAFNLSVAYMKDIALGMLVVSLIFFLMLTLTYKGLKKSDWDGGNKHSED